MRVLGFMTGTSLDGVDMAVVETDGESITALGPAGERKLRSATRATVEAAIAAARAWPRNADPPPEFAVAARAVADEHMAAARSFLGEHGLTLGDLDLIGAHGQTVLHEPPTQARAPGRTVQLIDARRLADGLSAPVAFDFRADDIAAGGQGAPLTPVYHAALVRRSGLTGAIAVLNLGGVANLTSIDVEGRLEAFDTGPANGMIDLWVQAHTDMRYDLDGELASAGRVSEAIVSDYLSHPYFAAKGPRSLDRLDFFLAPVEDLSLEDGAATLTAFAAEAVARGVTARSDQPAMLIACGGGRLNPVLMGAIRARLPMEVRMAEDVGWRGDSIEAEAFAYLAARTMRGLPISFPATTGVPRPMIGGRIVAPQAGSASRRLSR
jgi:anhydro-N-acetylmuramic acid kinase